MFKWMRNSNTDQPIDEQIELVLQEMTAAGVSSQEYPTYIKYLEQLSGIKAKRRRVPVSRDTMAYVFGNVVITLIIVVYEEKHVITSKAIGQLMKPRLDT